MSVDSERDVVRRHGPIGRKLQITVTDGQYAMLRAESERSDLPMAELIRRAVDAVYRPSSRIRVAGVELNLGILRHPDAAIVGRQGTRLPKSD